MCTSEQSSGATLASASAASTAAVVVGEGLAGVWVSSGHGEMATYLRGASRDARDLGPDRGASTARVGGVAVCSAAASRPGFEPVGAVGLPHEALPAFVDRDVVPATQQHEIRADRWRLRAPTRRDGARRTSGPGRRTAGTGSAGRARRRHAVARRWEVDACDPHRGGSGRHRSSSTRRARRTRGDGSCRAAPNRSRSARSGDHRARAHRCRAGCRR